MSSRRTLALLAVAAALLVPAIAHADGDPASDYLVVQDVFFPFDVKVPAPEAGQLSTLVADAKKRGFQIRVALIASRYDLGTAFSLYNKPQRYAQFLSFELSFVYRGRLLVVMPNGFGFAVNGRPDRKATRALAGLRGPGKSATKQAEAAVVAVRRLAAAEGHSLPASGRGGSSSRDRITIAAAATAGIALIAGLVLLRRQRRAQPD